MADKDTTITINCIMMSLIVLHVSALSLVRCALSDLITTYQ